MIVVKYRVCIENRDGCVIALLTRSRSEEAVKYAMDHGMEFWVQRVFRLDKEEEDSVRADVVDLLTYVQQMKAEEIVRIGKRERPDAW